MTNELPPRVDPILHKAADLLRDEGWIQESGFKPGKGRCLTRAVYHAAAVEDVPTLTAYLTAICKLGFFDLSQAIAWNDTKGRTKEEVIDRLEDTAFGREVK